MTEIFEMTYRVPASDENEANHVDNQVYLRWMNEVAFAHSASCGWSMDDYKRIGSAFVVKSHFIEYLAPTFKDEELLFMTWVSDMQDSSSTRNYQFFKLPECVPFMRAETKWVYVDFETGRPQQIPEEILTSFHPVSKSQVQQRLEAIKKGSS